MSIVMTPVVVPTLVAATKVTWLAVMLAPSIVVWVIVTSFSTPALIAFQSSASV
jgi:hypothetical protein